MTYSCMRMHTTIGAAAFHFRVRDGIGWCHSAMVARETVERRSCLAGSAPSRVGLGYVAKRLLELLNVLSRFRCSALHSAFTALSDVCHRSGAAGEQSAQGCAVLLSALRARMHARTKTT